jgi:hypothetical protein
MERTSARRRRHRADHPEEEKLMLTATICRLYENSAIIDPTVAEILAHQAHPHHKRRANPSSPAQASQIVSALLALPGIRILPTPARTATVLMERGNGPSSCAKSRRWTIRKLQLEASKRNFPVKIA